MRLKLRRAVYGMSCLLFLVGVSFFCVNYLHTFQVSTHKRAARVKAAVPASFGKTHFIVGQTPDQRMDAQFQEVSSSTVLSPFSQCTQSTQSAVFFTPDDDVRGHLINLILHEQERIDVAVFVFTDKQITRALVEAFERGVAVEVVTDATGLRDRYNRIRYLCDALIPVFVYDTRHGKAGLSSVMHHKFAIFYKNKNNQRCVWTGSCNFTKSACESNQENAILITDNSCVQKFSDQFEVLKQRSYRYQK